MIQCVQVFFDGKLRKHTVPKLGNEREKAGIQFRACWLGLAISVQEDKFCEGKTAERL